MTFFWLIVLAVINIGILFYLLLISRTFRNNRYWIPFFICLIIDLLGEMILSIDLNWGIFVSIIGLFGLPVVYFFNFNAKKDKSIIDYLKYVWLILFICPNFIRYIAFLTNDNIQNYNTFNSIKDSFLSHTIWIIGLTSTVILTLIFILTMIENYKTRNLIEIIE